MQVEHRVRVRIERGGCLPDQGRRVGELGGGDRVGGEIPGRRTQEGVLGRVVALESGGERFAAPVAEPVQRLSSHDRVEPRPERVGVAELTDLLVGLDERVLDDVGGIVTVLHGARREVVDGPEVPAVQGFERLGVSPLTGEDEIAV